jgi:hypothetical protein
MSVADSHVGPPSLNLLSAQHLQSKTETAGPGWFELPATPITPELKRDLHILNLRAHIDKSRKYKKGADPAKKMPKYFQVAEVIPSAQDYYRPGLARKDRVKSIAEQLLAVCSIL